MVLQLLNEKIRRDAFGVRDSTRIHPINCQHSESTVTAEVTREEPTHFDSLAAWSTPVHALKRASGFACLIEKDFLLGSKTLDGIPESFPVPLAAPAGDHTEHFACIGVADQSGTKGTERVSAPEALEEQVSHLVKVERSILLLEVLAQPAHVVHGNASPALSWEANRRVQSREVEVRDDGLDSLEAGGQVAIIPPNLARRLARQRGTTNLEPKRAAQSHVGPLGARAAVAGTGRHRAVRS